MSPGKHGIIREDAMEGLTFDVSLNVVVYAPKTSTSRGNPRSVKDTGYVFRPSHPLYCYL